MTKPIVLLSAMAAMALAADPAAAQFPDLDLGASVEFHAGALAPTGNWEVPDGNTTLRAGTGALLAGAVRLHLTPELSTYGSWNYGRPGCEDCALFDLDDRLVDTGFGFGAGYALFDMPPIVIRLDVGGIVHRLSFQGNGETRNSDFGLGFEAGLAGSFEIRPSLALEPAFTWRAYTAHYEFQDGGTRDIDVRYLAPRIGLRYRFW